MVLVENIPSFDFDGDDEIFEEGEGEIESGSCVSSASH